MSLQTLKDHVPDFAKDVRLNVGSLPNSTALNAAQLWGTVLACAVATRNPQVAAAAMADAAAHVPENVRQAALTAASLMGMNNVYYRALHLLNSDDYRNMPARLRMTAIANPGVERVDFELMCLGVSAINGCGMCLESHAHEVLTKGQTRDAVQEALRIAAIVQSLAVALEAAQVAQTTIAAAA